jgi:hypothetical protein
MDRVSLGIPVYGSQSKDWWGPLVRQAAELHRQDIELVDLHVVGSMMTDVNRNHIVDDFLKGSAEWLRWLDADNVDKLGSIRRLLDTRKTLVSGIYTKRDDSGDAVAYFATPGGQYQTVSGYTPGEIFPVDAAGLGGCLVHRSVFEDIQRNYFMFDMIGGGVITIHKDDIQGDVFDDALSSSDGKLIDGVLHLRLRQPQQKKPFAFFMLGFGRTEDYGFFEMAARSGHRLWLDTGVELGHLGEKVYTPAEVRQWEVKELQRHFYEALPLR